MADDTRGDVPLGDDELDRDGEPLSGTERDGLEERAEQRGTRRGVLIGVGAAVLVVLLGAVALWVWGPFRADPVPADNTTAVTELPALTGAPQATMTGTTPTTVPTGQQTADPNAEHTVSLSRWNWVPDQQMFAVAGMITTVEEGGTCTLTATKGSTTLQASESARPEASYTTCIVNLIATDAEPGPWQLTMTYDGPSGAGTSDTVTVTVP